MRPQHLRRTIAMLAVVAASLCAAETNYRQQIEAERKRLNDRLHSKDSPLGLISRFGVPRGRTAIGRGPENALQLAVSSGPQHFGVAMWDGEVFLFTPARGVEMRKAGSSEKAPVTEMRFATTSSEKNDGTGVQIGDVILRFTWFARSGVVRMGVTDQAAARIRTAPDRLWYPAEEKYRVQARWVPLDPTVKTSTADSTGDMRFDKFVGYAEFELEGQKLKLYAMKSGQSLFLPFTDRTAPKETYGGGRFLYAPAPVNGSITLDFNAASNHNQGLRP